MTLSAEAVYKTYGKRTVLENCSLTVSTGECVLLRGPSGGGKSTFLRILALLEPADAGLVCHGDRRWQAKDPGDVSPYPFLTVVFQQLFLWPNLTMGENLAIVLKHHLRVALPQAALEMLDRLSIAHLLERRPHECSLGERQRLAIARALLSDARFLLLDEPSSALDRVNRGILVQELSKALASNRGVLLVTHDDHGFDEIVRQSFVLENCRLERS